MKQRKIDWGESEPAMERVVSIESHSITPMNNEVPMCVNSYSVVHKNAGTRSETMPSDTNPIPLGSGH